MAANSKIEWCDATVNFWHGCYAETLSKRWGKDIWGKGKPREDHRAGATKLARKLNQMMGGLSCSHCKREFPPMTWKGWEEGQARTQGYPARCPCGLGSLVPRRSRFKHWGEWAPAIVDPIMCIARVGKKAAGRLLDGRVWSEFPTGEGKAR